MFGATMYMLLSSARARLWISKISLPVAGCGYDARYTTSAPFMASARAFSGYEPSLAIMMPRRPISVSTTGQNACSVRPYFSTHQSYTSCGHTESSPGMSIAHSRANVAWSRSSTSSLKACSAPSGKAMSRTGRSRLESHDAAFTRCERCSRLILMSLRLRMPRTVGMRPTAVYGLIMPRLLASSWSVTGNARDFRDAVIAKLDRHLVLLAVVHAPVDHGAPARRRDALVLLVGAPELRYDLVVPRAGGNQPDQALARRAAAVRRRGYRRKPTSAPAPLEAPAHVRAEHEHAGEVRHEQDQRGDYHRAPVDAAAEVVELDPEALRRGVLRREQRERHHLAAGAHAALAPHRHGRRDLLDLQVIRVAEVRDQERVLASQVHDPVTPLVVEREEPERRGPEVAEA